MATYTVQDKKTGKKITFEWMGEQKPTDADIMEVFEASRGTSSLQSSSTPRREFDPGVSQRARDFAGTGKMLGEMVGNYPRSYGNLLKNAATGAYGLVKHPIDSLNAMGKGVKENIIIPTIGAGEKMAGLDYGNVEKYESAKEKLIGGKYGSLENIAKYIKDDPAMAQADMALALTGGGKLAKLAGAKKLGSGLTKTGAMTEPMTAPLKAIGTGAKIFTPSRVAQKLYASSAKMSTVLDPDIRKNLSQKLLDAEVKLNNKGFKKLADDFESLWRGVDDMVDQYIDIGPNEKRTVIGLTKGLDEFEKRASLTGRSNIVKNVKNQFFRDLTETVDIGGKPIRVIKDLDAKEINRVKRDIYKELHSQYGKSMVPLKSEVKMIIAHNAMEMIEEMIPGVIPNNKTAAAYKEMMDAIKRGVNRIENRDLLSIGLPLKAGAGSIFSESMGINERIGGLGGLALGMLDIPSVKSKIAIRMNKLKKDGVKISPTATAIKIGLVKKGEYENKETNYEAMQRLMKQ